MVQSKCVVKLLAALTCLGTITGCRRKAPPFRTGFRRCCNKRWAISGVDQIGARKPGRQYVGTERVANQYAGVRRNKER
jgi:hypothetical protein